MYSSQEELAAMAAAAKRSLEGQQQKPSDDIYAGLFDDEEETTTPQVNTRIENVPQNIETHEYESSDEETLERLNVPGPHIDPYDDVLFPGGPTKSDIQLWKKEWEGYDIFVTEILNEKARATLSNIQVSFSVGFTNLNVPKANAADIIKLADRNMYRNKTFKKQQRQALEKEQSATKK